MIEKKIMEENSLYEGSYVMFMAYFVFFFTDTRLHAVRDINWQKIVFTLLHDKTESQYKKSRGHTTVLCSMCRQSYKYRWNT